MTKFAVIHRTVTLFSPKEQPTSFDKLPSEFEEANMLYKEDKKANLESIDTLLSPCIKAQLNLKSYKRAKQLFAEPDNIIDADGINITEVKYLKKLPIPTVSIEATFKLKVTDLYLKENKEDESWQPRNCGAIAEAISIKWNIEYWGVEGLDLSLDDYKESAIWIENE